AHALEDVHEIHRASVGKAAGAHRASACEYRRDVDSHRGHEHAGYDLVAVWYAQYAVESVSLQHGLYRVGDDLARGQAVLPTYVSHRNAVVYGDGVEFEGHTAGFAYRLFCDLAELLKMAMARDDVDIRVANRDERFVDIGVGHAASFQQAAMRCALGPALYQVASHTTPSRLNGPQKVVGILMKKAIFTGYPIDASRTTDIQRGCVFERLG